MNDQEKLELFYKQFGSENFRLQSKMAEDHGKKSLDLYFRSIGFIYKTITVIGIIAGFGFTAFGYVNNNLLFITGEAFLFSAMAVGIWATQKIYLSERRVFDKFYAKVHLHFAERNQLFKPIFDKAMNNSLTREDIKTLEEKDWKLISILQDSPEIEEDRKDNLPNIVWTIFSLFLIGGLFLLLSFLNCKL